MRKFITSAAVLTTAALLLSACGSSDASDDDAIRIATFPGTLHMVPIYVAQEKGFYDEAGIDVSTFTFSAAPEASAAMQSGDIDLLTNSPGNAMIQNANLTSPDKKIIIIADNYPEHVWNITAGPGQNFEPGGYEDVVRSLAGESIGVPAIGSEGHLFFKRFAQDIGLDPDNDFTYLAVGLGSEALSAITSGQISAMIGLEPVTTLIEDMGGTTLLSLRETETLPLFSNWTESSVMTTAKKAEEMGEKFTTFQEAHSKAIDFIRDPANADEVGEIWSRHNETLEAAQLSEVISRTSSDFDINFDCEALDAVAEFNVESDLIAPGDKQNCDDLLWSNAPRAN